MIQQTTLRRAGDSVAVTLPKDIVDRLNVGPGDQMLVVERDGGIFLMPYAPEFVAAMQAFEDVRGQYRNTLRELAE